MRKPYFLFGFIKNWCQQSAIIGSVVSCTFFSCFSPVFAARTVRIPDDWNDMGLGTGTLYDVPPNFETNDLPETRLAFPASTYASIYGFRAFIPAKKCPRWNRVQFALDYTMHPTAGNDFGGDGLHEFAQKLTEVMFSPHGSGTTSVTSDKNVVINGVHAHRVDLSVHNVRGGFCGTHYLNANFIKFNHQIVFMAFRDVGATDSVPPSLVERVIHTLRPFEAPVVRYHTGHQPNLPSPDQNNNNPSDPNPAPRSSPRMPRTH